MSMPKNKPVFLLCSEIDPKEIEIIDTELDKKETALGKISTGMGKVFLSEIAVERERRKSMKNRPIDPRSAARAPAANRMPHYKLRYDDPRYASPSRIADHIRPWDTDDEGGLRQDIIFQHYFVVYSSYVRMYG